MPLVGVSLGGVPSVGVVVLRGPLLLGLMVSCEIVLRFCLPGRNGILIGRGNLHVLGADGFWRNRPPLLFAGA